MIAHPKREKHARGTFCARRSLAIVCEFLCARINETNRANCREFKRERNSRDDSPVIRLRDLTIVIFIFRFFFYAYLCAHVTRRCARTFSEGMRLLGYRNRFRVKCQTDCRKTRGGQAAGFPRCRKKRQLKSMFAARSCNKLDLDVETVPRRCRHTSSRNVTNGGNEGDKKRQSERLRVSQSRAALKRNVT